MSKLISSHWHHQGFRIISQSSLEIGNQLYVRQYQPFSRKTKPANKQKGAQTFGNRDDAFSPPDQDGEDGNDEGNITFKHRIYVPKTPLAWDFDGRMLLFEVSPGMKRIPKLSAPSQIVTFATAFAMFEAYATLAFVKAFMFSMPFFALLTMSSYLTQQSGVIVAKIELIRDKELKLRKTSPKSEEGSSD